MRSLYLLSVGIHILSAAVWIGGMVALIAVLMPALRRPAYRAMAMPLLTDAALRLRTVGWTALVLLAATGLIQLGYRGLLAFQWSEYFTTPYGRLVAAKVLTFAVILAVSAVHDFRVGPRAAQLAQEQPDAPGTQRLRRLAGRLGRANFLLALVAIALGIFLVRGLP